MSVFVNEKDFHIALSESISTIIDIALFGQRLLSILMGNVHNGNVQK